ncbi:uncharacterized protein LOC123710754 isoform X1 [Pieris brassicae]|uniref:uncharacterized protein LOC123710754 isoform X1 n=1 Tax=Pieris brassicae TaxID=7116 RepID=UPI001E6618E6|nr:uncharacterized protein LOC123710754 isoform X1 [Pieris brassicae]
MPCEIIVRFARLKDLEKRRELVQNSYSINFWDAFLFFFFQELTLELCVLGAAVLFIFCGVSVAACAALVPAAAGVVAAAVLLYRYGLALKHAQNVSSELYGLVAEAHGSLLPSGNESLSTRINLTENEDKSSLSSHHGHIVGTVSVLHFQGAAASGWVEGLSVISEWRRHGVGTALTGAARQAAAVRGLQSLECALSHLQPTARRLLHSAGWECRGSYERRLAGAALTLPVLRLGTDLPLA